MGYAFAGFGSSTPAFLTQSARNAFPIPTCKRQKAKAGRKANRLRLIFLRRK